jgi:hypothetical protein
MPMLATYVRVPDGKAERVGKTGDGKIDGLLNNGTAVRDLPTNTSYHRYVRTWYWSPYGAVDYR